jgi:SH3 domain-containing YSC84-like protein 1
MCCRHFLSSSRFHVERAIPIALLKQAAGYAILSVVKVGMGWSAGVGTGLVVARREDGSWSPPSAIGLTSFGWGIQAGGELTDLLLVLSSAETVKVCHKCMESSLKL